jgi:hypothetical protein
MSSLTRREPVAFSFPLSQLASRATRSLFCSGKEREEERERGEKTEMERFKAETVEKKPSAPLSFACRRVFFFLLKK